MRGNKSKYGDDVMGKIVETIKEYGEEGITISEISVLTGFPPSVMYNRANQFESHGIVKRENAEGKRCYVYEGSTGKPEGKDEKKNDNVMKNAEGYTDRTAGEAIMGKRMNDFFVGGIYEGRYLVLKVFYDTLVYLDIGKVAEKREFITDTCVRFNLNGEECFVNPHRVWSVYTRKVDKTTLQSIDNALFKQIASLAGMNVTEVEKEVEKVVYKDKIVEKVIESDEVKAMKMELEFAKKEASIWEKAFMAVAK